MNSEKILIIRFSSIGDVVQCLSVASKLKEAYPGSEIHWVTRKDMQGLLSNNKNIDKVWALNKAEGVFGLLKFAIQLRKENFSRIYDAHNNSRSFVIRLVLNPFGLGPMTLIRSVERWKRFLLFQFRINKFEQPFSGQRDFLTPLKKWGIQASLPKTPQMFISTEALNIASELIKHHSPFIALVPSAAFLLKRWPKEYFTQLILELPDAKFVCLGGNEDTFIEEISSAAPGRVLNLAGKCSLQISAAVIQHSQLVVANDTGLMHIAEQLGKPLIALMGPAPFGFPSRRPATTILERNLACRPCSKHGQGPCVNKNFHECLVDIKPEEVASIVMGLL